MNLAETVFGGQLLLAIPIGILSAIKQYSIFDQIATLFAYLGNALPTFVSGLLAYHVSYAASLSTIAAKLVGVR